jgi:hypothetical protein
MSAEDRAEVTAAVHRLDAVLQWQPDLVGESRSGNARIVFVPPLVITFRVLPEDRVVQVLSVRLLPPRGGA